MSIHSYLTDEEHNQAALDIATRLIFDRASDILSDGNPIDESIKAVSTISSTALHHGLSNTVINSYYVILDDENKRSE